jgi:hypothetical protein
MLPYGNLRLLKVNIAGYIRASELKTSVVNYPEKAQDNIGLSTPIPRRDAKTLLRPSTPKTSPHIAVR